MSMISFQLRVASSAISVEEQHQIIQIIEEGLTELGENATYQSLLNFVMGMNAEFGSIILLKVHDKAPIPHISEIRDNLRAKALEIHQKVGTH